VKIQFANALRGIAALTVMFSHYFSFWIDPAAIASVAHFPAFQAAAPATPSYVRAYAATYPFAPPAFGVALFFMVSGFVIPFSFASYGRLGFLVARIMRLYPTYMVGFGITVVSLGVAAIGWHRAFPYPPTAVLSHILPGVRDLIGGPNIDYVVWTLEVEVKFYVVCLLIAPLLRSGSALAFLAPAAIAALVWIGLSHPPSNTALGAALFSGPMLIFMFIGVALPIPGIPRQSSCDHHRYAALCRILRPGKAGDLRAGLCHHPSDKLRRRSSGVHLLRCAAGFAVFRPAASLRRGDQLPALRRPRGERLHSYACARWKRHAAGLVHPACRSDRDKRRLPFACRDRTADASAGTALGTQADGMASASIGAPRYPERNGRADNSLERDDVSLNRR
jgi:Acyltransferase family